MNPFALKSKLKNIFAILIITLFITGCSFFEPNKGGSASVSLQFPEEVTQKIAAAARTAPSRTAGENPADTENAEDSEIFIELSLKGGYEATQTVLLTKPASVTFTEIPTGIELWAEALIYQTEKENSEKLILYTGSSDPITVTEGENQLTLKLKKSETTTAEEEEEGEPPITYIDIYVSATGDDEEGDGSQTHPYENFAKAFEAITDSESDYRIVVVGEMESASTITFDSTLVANSITISGMKDAENVDGRVKNTSNSLSLFAVTTSVPVIFKNIILDMTKAPAYGTDILGIILNVDTDGDVTIGNGATLINTLYSSSAPSHCRGAIYSKGQVIIENGALIKDFQANQGGGVHVAAGTVTMNGGQIQNCWSRYGGGVYVTGGSFIMNGNAVIGGDAASEGCESLNYGGGVYITSSGSFAMNGSSRISYCGKDEGANGSVTGGGVYCEGQFIMNAGKICNCIAGNETYKGKGGGVYLKSSSAIFNMNGGTIENITNADSDSGVYVDSSATFKMKGNAVISSGNCVYLTSGRKIIISGELTGNARVASITPANYSTETTVLDIATDAETSSDVEYGKFTITKKNGTIEWSINTDGSIKKTYFGDKNPLTAKSVGDIVFKDGSSTPYTSGLLLTDDETKAAIALIFYVGTGLNSGDDTSTTRTLGVGLVHEKNKLAWCRKTNDEDFANACNINIETIQCTVTEDNDVSDLYYITGDKNGSDNLQQIAAFLQSEGKTDDTGTAENYPAFYFAKNYSEHKIGEETVSRVSGTAFENGWYLPSIAELYEIYRCRKDSENGFDIDTASSLCGGNEFGITDSTNWYLSSSQTISQDESMAQFNFIETGYAGDYYKYFNTQVCAIREF